MVSGGTCQSGFQQPGLGRVFFGENREPVARHLIAYGVKNSLRPCSLFAIATRRPLGGTPLSGSARISRSSTPRIKPMMGASLAPLSAIEH
jgi:hypothetical protein